MNGNLWSTTVWWERAAVPGQCEPAPTPSFCDYAESDHYQSYVIEGGLTCAGAPYEFTLYSAQAKGCGQPCQCPPFPNPSCICNFQSWLNFDGMLFRVPRRALGCEPPRKQSCSGDSDCHACLAGQGKRESTPEGPPGTGIGGPSTGVWGGGPGLSPDHGGPGTTLRYQAGGIGNPGSPGWTSWREILGRFWSHDFAERIVRDPDDSHVWLLTRFSTFREYSNPDVGGRYQVVSPSDEFRNLYLLAGGGWELRFQDGTIQRFDDQGFWQETVQRETTPGTGRRWSALAYDGVRILEVSMPDGRREQFTYYPTGRLASIQEIGRDGSAGAIWRYDWVGSDLYRIRRPDGTRLVFTYGRLDLPGYLTQVLVVGSGANPPIRIDGSWEYDGEGNVLRFWKGAASFDQGVEKWQLSYDDPVFPTLTEVTDPLGGVSTYHLEFEPGDGKFKVTQIDGSCPTCGSPPNTILTYDVEHPLLVASETNVATGQRTEFTYWPTGRLKTRIDGASAVGHPHLPRIIEWSYDATFPSLVTAVTGPTYLYDQDPPSRIATSLYSGSTGNLLSSTISGNEATQPGGIFNFTTQYSGYNSVGMVGTIDPPGYGAADQTIFTYDVLNANGMLPDTQANPLVGLTRYEYDQFSRRTRVVDPNLVGAVHPATDTQYDSLGRVTAVVQRPSDTGAPTDPPGPSDRPTIYLYNAFGELGCVKLPNSNGTANAAGIQYIYDWQVTYDVPDTAMGRLIEIRRGSLANSPTATNCLVVNSTNPADRIIWQYGAGGHRVNERRERSTNGTSWTIGAETTYVYTTMCHFDRTIQAPGQPEESITESAYDCNGNLERIWDGNHPRATFPDQPTSLYRYDEINRVVSMTQPSEPPESCLPTDPTDLDCVTVRFEHDVQNHIIKVTDGEGTVTQYEYSDRDLMTSQLSEVAGATTYSYNDHGELFSETDARNVTINRTIDAADRVTLMDYADDALDTTFNWAADPGSCYLLGRLESILRGSTQVDYCYDPFGQVLEDGAISNTYDKNGNRLTTGYPGNLTATYTYDRMDRPRSLVVQELGGQVQTIVSNSPAATYKPFGPLATLRLATTTARDLTRGYDRRYSPMSLSLSGALFSWIYSTDSVGNIVGIDDTLATNQDRSFTYADWQYYLTLALGPWGSAKWTYDRAGNRVYEDSGAGHGALTYVQNAAGTGNTSELVSALGGRGYTFDDAGILDFIDASGNTFDFVAGDDSRLSLIIREAVNSALTMSYDGRGFLSRVEVAKGEPPYTPLDKWTAPIYSSDGVLMSLERRPAEGAPTERLNILYFAGSPIALWKKPGTGTPTTTWLVTDHLGTPAASLLSTGSPLDWYGGFEPFGRDWQENTPQDASSKGILLRLPGQWDDPIWNDATLGANVFYNVHRWYEPLTARFTKTDPLGMRDGPNVFSYARSSPTRYFDRLGLSVLICSRKTDLGIGNHAYFWDDRPGLPPGKPRFCGKGDSPHEDGPGVDECNMVPESPGREDDLMNCCAVLSEYRMGFGWDWSPITNDCHTQLHQCQRWLLGVDHATEAPGGRLGPPCDICEPVEPPMPPPDPEFCAEVPGACPLL